MRDLIRKLTSRKFITALAGLIFGITLAFGGDEDTIRTVSGAVTTMVTVLAYILTEGKIDREAIMPERDEEEE